MKFQDTYQQKGLRKKLLTTLEAKGIADHKVLEAFNKVPRHFFFESSFKEKAYDDSAFPIGNDQTISQPFTVAYQTSLLDVKKRDKILEIGTGSGFQACILSALGARVYSIERQKMLYDKAKTIIKELNFGVRTFWKDGYKGLPEFAPFDKILVTAGATEIPQALLSQLKIGGFLVIPVGNEIQQMIKVTRLSENEYKEEVFGNFKFVPFLKGTVKDL